MDKKARLARLQEECAAYFNELYAPDQKVYVFGDGDPQALLGLLRGKVADRREAQDVEVVAHALGQPQRGQRQTREGLLGLAWLDEDHRGARVPGGRVGGAPGVGDRDTDFEVRCGEAVDDRAKHHLLTAVQVIGARRVDDEPVRRIGRDHRGEAQRPDG